MLNANALGYVGGHLICSACNAKELVAGAGSPWQEPIAKSLSQFAKGRTNWDLNQLIAWLSCGDSPPPDFEKCGARILRIETQGIQVPIT